MSKGRSLNEVITELEKQSCIRRPKWFAVCTHINEQERRIMFDQNVSDKKVSDELSEVQKQYIADHLQFFKTQYADHKGEWLTDEACKEYRERARLWAILLGYPPFAKRKVREELQARYGLLEVEAANIIAGVYSHSYVEKYKLIHAMQNVDEWVGPYLKDAKIQKNGEIQENESN